MVWENDPRAGLDFASSNIVTIERNDACYQSIFLTISANILPKLARHPKWIRLGNKVITNINSTAI